MSTALTVRRLLVDLDTPFARRWNGGDAFRTALFNALSMSFPAGEQVFIDSLKRGLAALPESERARWQDEVRGFIGQEATHRHIHQRFNAQLAAQGAVNRWEARIVARRAQMNRLAARNWVGVTAATEHLTAVFAEVLLNHPRLLQGATPALRDLWLWHSCEETEHRSVAFDMYRAIGGNELWRRRLFRVVSGYFAADLTRQTLRNLWHDGALFLPSTWVSAWKALFARGGLVREGLPLWRRYLHGDFHPGQADGEVATAWLAAHVELAPPVMAAGAAAAAATAATAATTATTAATATAATAATAALDLGAPSAPAVSAVTR